MTTMAGNRLDGKLSRAELEDWYNDLAADIDPSDEQRELMELIRTAKPRGGGQLSAFVEAARAAGDDVRVGRPAGSPTSNQYGTFAVHAASDKQVAFARRLLETKIVKPTIKVPTKLDGISKKACSALIDQLLGCEDKPDATGQLMASEKQVSFIRKLLGEKAHEVDVPTFEYVVEQNKLTAKSASGFIDILLKLPRKPVETKAEVILESGIYRVGENIYKVYINQAKTRMLAKLLVLGEDGEEPTWEYAGMASRFVKAEQRMTLEQAKEFGAIYGVCCNCGRTLTDEGSIEAGIGPVCARKGSWA